jgi:hypothetical protein
MPNSTQEEKYRWLKPILNKEITIKQMTKLCPFSKRALQYWLASYRRAGLVGLNNRSTRPRSNYRETPIRIKERVIELRRKTNLSALKLYWKLKKEGVDLHKNTIHKVIKQEGLVRRYRTRKIKLRSIKTRLNLGELVEIDVKYVPQRLSGRRFYQFTAIDCASRWRLMEIYEAQGNGTAIKFLH